MVPNADPIPAPPAKNLETKFVLDDRCVPPARALIEARCRRDPVWPVGIVLSVYYDTPDWLHLREKLDGTRRKSKVRLRWYATAGEETPIGTAFLEHKARRGARRKKVRIDTGIPATELADLSLSDPALRRVPQLLREHGLPISGALLPVFELRYLRHRYVDPCTGARLSLDSEIRVSRTNAVRVLPARPFALRDAVFEVKGSLDDLPEGLVGLRELGFRKSAFSKYGACARLLRYGHRSFRGGVA